MIKFFKLKYMNNKIYKFILILIVIISTFTLFSCDVSSSDNKNILKNNQPKDFGIKEEIGEVTQYVDSDNVVSSKVNEKLACVFYTFDLNKRIAICIENTSLFIPLDSYFRVKVTTKDDKSDFDYYENLIDDEFKNYDSVLFISFWFENSNGIKILNSFDKNIRLFVESSTNISKAIFVNDGSDENIIFTTSNFSSCFNEQLTLDGILLEVNHTGNIALIYIDK